MTKNNKVSVGLIAVLLAIWLVLVIRVDDRWYGVQEAPRIWVPAGIRNYHEYGLETTGLMVIRDTQPTTPDEFEYYSHHPPIIIWLPALFSELLGFNELAVRIGFIYGTLLSAVLFYVMLRRLYGTKIALWAMAFYGLVPMVAYYGRVPGHDQLGLAIIFAFGAIMLNWLQRPTRGRFYALIGLAWLAVWTAWTAVFFVGTIGLAGMWLGNRAQRQQIVGLGVVCVVAFIALMGFYQLQWSGSIDSILDAFVWRSSNASDDPDSVNFTVFEFIGVTLAHTFILMGVGIVIMSIGGLFVMRKRGWDKTNAMALALFMGGVIYQLVFRNASYVHDYYKIMFAPAIALSAGVFWVYVHERPAPNRLRPIVDALLVVSLIIGGYMLVSLHDSGDRPWITAVTDWVNENADEDDRIVTHLIGKDNLMPLRFYTYRVIDEGVDFSTAQTIAEDDDARVLYIHCPTIGVDTAPENVGAYDTVDVDECEIVLIE